MITTIALVAAFGSAGAVARYAISDAIHRRMSSVFAWGTWLVNVLGSFGLGLLIGLVGRFDAPEVILTMIGFGFLGAFTTFSTWMYETLRLIEDGAWIVAFWNLLGSIVAGMLAAAGGLLTVRMF